jgi:probable rRNA maturation factor
LGCDAHEISLVITDNAQIRELNRTYRGLDKPTNVLAFPMQEGEFSEITPGLLGDLVLSCETALQEAEDADITLKERISQLLVHGILHLMGFDHEQGESQAREMEDKSLALLRKIEPNKDLTAF